MSIRNQFVSTLGILALTPVIGVSAAMAQQTDTPPQPASCSTAESALLTTAGKLWGLMTWTIDPKAGRMKGKALNTDVDAYRKPPEADDSGKYSIDVDATFDPKALTNFNLKTAKYPDNDDPPIPTQITQVVIKRPTGVIVYILNGKQLVPDDAKTTDQDFKTMPPADREKPEKFGLIGRSPWISANDAVFKYADACGSGQPSP